jgi:hypothetical protein
VCMSSCESLPFSLQIWPVAVPHRTIPYTKHRPPRGYLERSPPQSDSARILGVRRGKPVDSLRPTASPHSSPTTREVRASTTSMGVAHRRHAEQASAPIMQGARRANIPSPYSTDVVGRSQAETTEQRRRMGCIGSRMPTYLWDGTLEGLGGTRPDGWWVRRGQ